MPMTFVRPRLLRVNGSALTDHNRQPVSVDPQRIETRQRMANGTMRRYFVADKRTFSVTWNDLPTLDAQTVDGFFGAASIENLYNTQTGAVTLGISPASGAEVNYTCMITSFNKTISKRYSDRELWTVSMTFEEV